MLDLNIGKKRNVNILMGVFFIDGVRLCLWIAATNGH
jgi:hypothetical protein